MKDSTGSSDPSALVGKAEFTREPLLELERELIGLVLLHQVQAVAHPPEEIERGIVVGGLGFGEQACMQEVSRPLDRRIHRARDPPGTVVVAKPSGSLLQVGLQQVE